MNSKSILFRCILAFLFLLPISAASDPPQHGAGAPDGWLWIANGIDYQLFHFSSPRPINIFVTRMNRAVLSVTIDSAIANGKLTDGRETVRNMASRYDQAINSWGGAWGGRNHVAVAINGYFFNLGSGTPLSGQVQSGWYAKRFSEFVGDAGFAWGMNRNALIGDCVYHIPKNQYLIYQISGESQKIANVNVPRGADQLILYTPQYDMTTNTDNSGLEILVEMSRPSLVLPEPAQAKGIVKRIRDHKGSTPIPFDHIVLSASGLIRSKMLNQVEVGDEIGISQEITDCAGTTPKNWTKAYASMGGDYHFLKNGVIQSGISNGDAAVPNSRTAIAYNPGYVYFIVVDGWNKGVSQGIKVSELASFTTNALLATDAVTLDSGGSSTMVINGQVVNNTYCNFTRNCGMKPEEGQPDSRSSFDAVADLQAKESLQDSPESLEPLVGNAMLMVVVEPKSQSTTFKPTQSVITTEPAAMYLGPGTNYPVLTVIPAGFEGIVMAPYYDDYSGVFARNWFWWKVDFAGTVGWIRENSLRAGSLQPVELWIDSDRWTMFGEVTTLRAMLSYPRNSVYSWDLGDGSTSNDEVVTHLYPQLGYYTAKLTAWIAPNVLRASARVIITDVPFSHTTYFPLVNR